MATDRTVHECWRRLVYKSIETMSAALVRSHHAGRAAKSLFGSFHHRGSSSGLRKTYCRWTIRIPFVPLTLDQRADKLTNRSSSGWHQRGQTQVCHHVFCGFETQPSCTLAMADCCVAAMSWCLRRRLGRGRILCNVQPAGRRAAGQVRDTLG